jgi:hypothetical protein
MFDLEQSIAEWRQQMLAAGIKSPVVLAELEGHLREEIGRRAELGMNEQMALEISIRHMGQPGKLKSEFIKIERNIMKQIKIGAGIISILVGLAFVMPAVAQARNEGAMVNSEVALMLFGIALTIVGAGLVFRPFKKRNA